MPVTDPMPDTPKPVEPVRCQRCNGERWLLERDIAGGLMVACSGCDHVLLLHDDDDLADAEAVGARWAEETARGLASILDEVSRPAAKEWATVLRWFARRIHGGRIGFMAGEEFMARFGVEASPDDADPRGPVLLLPIEVSTMLGIHSNTLRNWANTGKLTPVRTKGGHRRYDEAQVLALLEPPAKAAGNGAGHAR